VRTRRLGKTDLEMTTVGLGTWAMGGPWEVGWGPQDDGEAIAAIAAAVECGVNWIDTAPIYGCGHSEELVGAALRHIRPRPLVATKCGMLWNDRRERVFCLKGESVRRECEDSLRRLGIDVIDLYQIHRPTPEEDIEQAWEAMVALKEQGKVRHIGVSAFSIDQMDRLARIHPVESLQPIYSMLHRQIEPDVLSACEGKGIGLVTYSPLGRGLLTGRFTAETLASLAPDDHRLRIKDFQHPQFEATLGLVDALWPLAKTAGVTLGQLAIAWVLRRPEVTSAIVGARSPGQIVETAPAGDVTLSKDILERIETLLMDRQESLKQRV